MKVTSLAKAMLFVTIAVATSIVTSSVLARGGAKKQAASAAKVSNPSDMVVFIRPQRQPPQPTRPSAGFASMKYLKVEPLGDGFHVTGQASIRDLRPSASYVWSIRVREPVSKTFVAENRYDAQAFRPPLDTHELSPTFDDTFRPSLPPGTYKLELVLYEVPRGGVGLLSDPAMREHQLMAKNTVEVTIGN